MYEEVFEKIKASCLGYKVCGDNHIKIYSARHSKYVNFYPSNGGFNLDGCARENARGIDSCLRFIEEGEGTTSGYIQRVGIKDIEGKYDIEVVKEGEGVIFVRVKGRVVDI